MIRITGGTFRSRLLKTPNSDKTKPTMDKVRQGVFSSIGDDIVNSRVLDLFSGSGSYGFEALSRGCRDVTFVDKGFEQIKVIKENARALGVNDLVNINCCDTLTFVDKLNNEKFDFIFVDPPYKLDVYNKIIDIVFEKHLLNEDGALILETENVLNIDENLYKIKILKYGLAKIYILRRK